MTARDIALKVFSGRVPLWVTVAGVGVTQMIGWGASFTALTVLGTPITRDLGLSRTTVFGGLTMMMAIGAGLAPWLGRHIDGRGGRELMALGSLVGAVALVLIAVAGGPVLYLFGWTVLGLSVAMMLNNASIPALVQVAGSRSRQAVTVVTIMSGLTSTLFLPLTAWCEAHFGWRMSFILFAALYAVICLPIHLAVLPVGRPDSLCRATSGSDEPTSLDGSLPENRQRVAFWLAATWMSMQALLVWGFNVQVVDILEGYGFAHATAIGVWIVYGPAQAVTRLVDLGSGGRVGVMTMALMGAICGPLGLLLLLLAGPSVVAATLMSLAVGIGQGLYAVARNLVPLQLFGLRRYGANMGWMSVPLNIASAAAPLLFSLALSALGARTTLFLAAATSAASLFAIAQLVVRVRAEADAK